MDIFDLVVVHGLDGPHEVILALTIEATIGNVNGSIMLMDTLIGLVTLGVEGLKPLAHWDHTLCGPTRRFPAIEVHTLGTGVHHEIDGGPTTEDTTTWHNGLTAIEVLRGFRFMEPQSISIVQELEYEAHVQWWFDCQEQDGSSKQRG